MKHLSGKVSPESFNAINELAKDINVKRDVLVERAVLQYVRNFNEGELKDVNRMQLERSLQALKAKESAKTPPTTTKTDDKGK